MHTVLWGICFWVKQISKGLYQFTLSASLMTQMVKNLPVMQEIQVLSLGWEDPLEQGMAPHCSVLSWRIP